MQCILQDHCQGTCQQNQTSTSQNYFLVPRSCQVVASVTTYSSLKRSFTRWKTPLIWQSKLMWRKHMTCWAGIFLRPLWLNQDFTPPSSIGSWRASKIRVLVWLVNGSTTEWFDSCKGLRQGDPLAPYLFIIAIEALTRKVRITADTGDITLVQVARGPKVSLS